MRIALTKLQKKRLVQLRRITLRHGITVTLSSDNKKIIWENVAGEKRETSAEILND